MTQAWVTKIQAPSSHPSFASPRKTSSSLVQVGALQLQTSPRPAPSNLLLGGTAVAAAPPPSSGGARASSDGFGEEDAAKRLDLLISRGPVVRRPSWIDDCKTLRFTPSGSWRADSDGLSWGRLTSTDHWAFPFAEDETPEVDPSTRALAAEFGFAPRFCQPEAEEEANVGKNLSMQSQGPQDEASQLLTRSSREHVSKGASRSTSGPVVSQKRQRDASQPTVAPQALVEELRDAVRAAREVVKATNVQTNRKTYESSDLEVASPRRGANSLLRSALRISMNV
eukprot:CAMPEP_0177539854 /NCGR_PEP_ID=MMETSP0369-20130122/59226_1 /TAXON_ID=447022 ORGANISM="Scrippsiella hangoei-like, Strain SHHI-4" /NCGR_SAMPLE_ID=MMETSP0369 /ASSEMBLY_ACC=CAM_ASM_000364 /LENGTH=282 /DNA_ID=CAMNT_0019022947 /DNA_START=15 /DNA_END=864 /DNA_ORIENTATION=-